MTVKSIEKYARYTHAVGDPSNRDKSRDRNTQYTSNPVTN